MLHLLAECDLDRPAADGGLDWAAAENMAEAEESAVPEGDIDTGKVESGWVASEGVATAREEESDGVVGVEGVAVAAARRWAA